MSIKLATMFRWKETCTKEIMMRLQWKEQYGAEFKRREEEEEKKRVEAKGTTATTPPKASEDQENVMPKQATPLKVTKKVWILQNY